MCGVFLFLCPSTATASHCANGMEQQMEDIVISFQIDLHLSSSFQVVILKVKEEMRISSMNKQTIPGNS